MKIKNRCPKCRAAKVARIPGGAKSQSIQVGLLASSGVPVDRYVCLRCGYVEHWVSSGDDLTVIGKNFPEADAEDE